MTADALNCLLGTCGGAAIKIPVKAATTANITLSGEQTIDGVSLVTGDRVLVKDQTDAVGNGIWVVSTAAWSRAEDFNGDSEAVTGTIVFVTNGTTNGNTFWRVTTSGTITIGTTGIAFGQSVNQLAGVSAFMETLLDDSDAATARTTLGVSIGSDVQAYDAKLADIAGLTLSQGDILYYDGSDIVNLGPGTSGQFLKTQGGGANPVWDDAGLVAATQAEMEAASSTTVAVTPGRTQYHPGVAKAWARFSGSGTPTMKSSYGFSSTITDNGTGDYTLTLSTAMSSSNYTAIAHTNCVINGITIAAINALTTTTVRIVCQNLNGSVLDPSDVYVVVYGDQ